jgi:hypothetical protein
MEYAVRSQNRRGCAVAAVPSSLGGTDTRSGRKKAKGRGKRGGGNGGNGGGGAKITPNSGGGGGSSAVAKPSGKKAASATARS